MRFITSSLLVCLFTLAASAQQTEEGPDDCRVLAEAVLRGIKISGTLELSAAASCFDLPPFASLRYLHPEYRDLQIGEIPLYRGRKIPFEFVLDSRDLARTIHPLQVVLYVRPAGKSKAVPLTSFWLEAEIATKETTSSPQEGRMSSFLPMAPVPEKETQVACGEISNLRLENYPERPTAPVILSWDQPNCCRELACRYAVWGGRSAGELRLLIHGRAGGRRVQKVLSDLTAEDDFFELMVETPAGIRQAFLQPGLPTPLTSDNNAEVKETPQSSAPLDLQQARLSLRDFSPCRYNRQLSPEGHQSISAGAPVEIRYDHQGKGYRYTLYFNPDGTESWFLAPGTTEMQDTPVFQWQVQTGHTGRYLVLIYKPSKKWGCLSSAPAEALHLTVSQ